MPDTQSPQPQPSVFHPVRARYTGERRNLRSIDRAVHRTHLDAEGNPAATLHLHAGHTLEESAHNVYGYTQLLHVDSDKDHPQQPPVVLGLGIRLLPEHEAQGLTPHDLLGRTFWHSDGTTRRYEFHEARADMEPVDADPGTARNLAEWDQQHAAPEAEPAAAAEDESVSSESPSRKSSRRGPSSVPSESAPAAGTAPSDAEQGQGA